MGDRDGEREPSAFMAKLIWRKVIQGGRLHSSDDASSSSVLPSESEVILNMWPLLDKNTQVRKFKLKVNSSADGHRILKKVMDRSTVDFKIGYEVNKTDSTKSFLELTEFSPIRDVATPWNRFRMGYKKADDPNGSQFTELTEFLVKCVKKKYLSDDVAGKIVE